MSREKRRCSLADPIQLKVMQNFSLILLHNKNVVYTNPCETFWDLPSDWFSRGKLNPALFNTANLHYRCGGLFVKHTWAKGLMEWNLLGVEGCKQRKKTKQITAHQQGYNFYSSKFSFAFKIEVCTSSWEIPNPCSTQKMYLHCKLWVREWLSDTHVWMI